VERSKPNRCLSRKGRDQIRHAVDRRLGAEVVERMREVMLGQLVREWMTTLTPGPFAVMAFKTANSTFTLRVAIE
jgi:hypothetical protein